jgi:hypothetical protein
MPGMRQEEIWDAEAARTYDTPGEGVFAPEVLGPTVDRLAGLAGDGRRWSSPSGRAGWPCRSPSAGCRSPGSNCQPR